MFVRGRSTRAGASALLVVATAFALLFVAPPSVAVAAQGQAMPGQDGQSVRGPSGTLLTAGLEHACAVRFGGSVVCWGGTNSLGELSSPQGTFSAVSTRNGATCAIRYSTGTVVCWGTAIPGNNPPPADVFTSIAVGYNFICGIRATGSIVCRGSGAAANGYPTLGTFVAITAGYGFACAIRTGGSATCWGDNEYGQATAPAGAFVSVAAGTVHACGVRIDRTVDCWGRNNTGQAADPTGTFRAVTAGAYHSCGIRMNGTVSCWGGGSYQQATAPSGTYTELAAGYNHTCARKTDGTLYCWGKHDQNQNVVPTGTFPTGSGPLIAPGDYQTCGITLQGTLGCFGDNTYGQAKPPAGLFIAVSSGTQHGCAISVDGTIACWGSNTSNQLAAPAGTYTAISAGSMHTCALSTAGTVSCWGYSGWGQTAVQTDTFVAIETGLHFSCGIRVDASLKCWGYNANGESTPPTTGAYVALSAGYRQACAIKTDGSPACWGDPAIAKPDALGTYTALAEGMSFGCGLLSSGAISCWGAMQGDSDPPTGETFVSVSAGDNTACAVTTTGQARCWGRNTEGEAAPLWAAGPKDAADGQPYSSKISMATPMFPAPTFSLVSGALPPDLTLAANGTITGTSTTVGTYSFTVAFWHGVAPASSMQYKIHVFPTAVRFSGADRFKTAVEVSKRTFPGGATTAYVAYAYNFPDALAAAAAAGTVHGPVLLTDTNSLNPDTANELTRLHPSKIIALGSIGAISNDTMHALTSYAPLVVRYYGSDRFKTAVDVSKRTFPTGASTVYIAYAYNFPDALAGAAAAGTVEGPVLLTDTNSLNPDTAAELDRLHPSTILVLGSQGVISETTLTAISKHAPLTIRYWGPSRFATAAYVSYRTFSPGVPVAYIAYAYNFPDALAGAAAAGTVKGPVLLTDTNSLDQATITELTRLKPHKIVVLGSSGVISDAVLTSLKAYAVP